MSRVIHWLRHHDCRVFFWVNRRIQNAVLDYVLPKVTHLGGAAATILTCLGIALATEGEWRHTAWISLAALAFSHLPVAHMKKKYPRKRPYLVLPEANRCKNPLTDHSFPSGHTTAIFSVIVPFVCLEPGMGTLLLPLAALVSLSRIYLGLHYPSDCLAGCLIGVSTSLLMVAIAG